MKPASPTSPTAPGRGDHTILKQIFKKYKSTWKSILEAQYPFTRRRNLPLGQIYTGGQRTQLALFLLKHVTDITYDVA
jgi:hypothetical protein